MDMTTLKKKDFYFDLPKELIAQDPLEDRASSRLLVLDKDTGAVSHHVFREVADYLRPGDCLVLNDTKVIPARLLGQREGTGAHVEVLLLKRLESDVWEALVRPGKKCRPGTGLTFGDGLLKAQVLETGEEGSRLIRFFYEGIFEEVLDRLGEMPLPPYITHKLEDKNRYQTVYAKYEGSAAAPTAGLHFTQELLEQIREKGVEIVSVTLHVGLGTFRPCWTIICIRSTIRCLWRLRRRSTGPERQGAALSVWEPPAAGPWRALRTRREKCVPEAETRTSLFIRDTVSKYWTP